MWSCQKDNLLFLQSYPHARAMGKETSLRWRLRRLQSKERRNRIREPSIIFQSWLSGHPQKKMKRDTDKRMTYQDCIPRPLTSSRIPVQWLETWELVFSSTALGSFPFLLFARALGRERGYERRMHQPVQAREKVGYARPEERERERLAPHFGIACLLLGANLFLFSFLF